MKKMNVFLLCIIIALVSGIIGFAIGITINGNSKNENNLVGTYKTNSWNGKEAVLVLQKDKTMIHPTGYNGTWLMNEGKLYIEYDYIDTVGQSADEMITMFSKENQPTSEKNYMKHEKQEITIVEGGLILSGHFFEKVINNNI